MTDAAPGAALPVNKCEDGTHICNASATRPARKIAALFGPWSPDLQFRALAMGAAVFFGSDHAIVQELRCAEEDSEAAARALASFDELPSLTRRRLLSVFASVTWPRSRRRAP